MAAVAPAQAPSLVETVPHDEAAAAADAPADENMDAMNDEEHHDDHEDDDEEENENEVKEWDEGGKSHCGYGDSVHDTLMSIGETIHKVVGDPNDGVQGAMQSIGNWFQEASYAARDLQSGNMDVAGETAAVMKSVVSGDEDDNQEDGEAGADADAEMKDGEDAKLSPVKEDVAKEGEASP